MRPTASGAAVRRAKLAARRVAAVVPLVAAAALSGCVTTYEPVGWFRKEVDATGVSRADGTPIGQPVTIPIPDQVAQSDRLLVAFYDGILQRLQAATDDGDVAMIDSLVAAYDRSDLPPALKAHLRGYHGIARGIEFQRRVRNSARLQQRAAEAAADAAPPDAAPPLGEPLRLEMALPSTDVPVLLGGARDRDPVGFWVNVTIDDEYADGSTRHAEVPHVIWLPATFDLADGAALTLPIDVDVPAGDAVRRAVMVRVDLMPGYVRYGDVRAPVHRVVVGGGDWVQWPKGYEVLAEAPLRALRASLQAFTPDNFAGVYLSALFVPDAQRAQANELLIDHVRYGKVDQARVATAALKRTNPDGPAIGDRDAWLLWWRQAGR